MTGLVRAIDLIGRPVVTVDGGDDIAEVKDVVYHVETRRLVGFTLNKRGWFRGAVKELLPAAQVHGIGDTAVMVVDEAALTAPDDSPVALSDASPARNVLDDRVLTEGGVELGVVVGLVLVVDAAAEAVGYEVVDERGGHKFIPVDAQVSVSGSSLVVADWATEFVREDLSDFGAAVTAYRTRHGGAP